jgi:glycosidase
MTDHKLTIYQLLPRLFGNTNSTNKHYGSVEENGCGKLNDINAKALAEIAGMGFTHVWYTGVIEHATMTDFSAYGITPDDPDVVKGRAGSPYAIKDYYDIAPDLAVDVPNRLREFEALIQRTHAAGLKAIIDFVPNHVARTYRSDAKPQGLRDIGEDDDNTKAFSATNDFYYLPGEAFRVPQGYNPGGDDFVSPLKDGFFDENPAKATGDNVFNASPSVNNWFETIKLNYGIDFVGGYIKHFEPIPPLWHKLVDILSYWADKGVDGFRCDMVEYVPFEFWGWMIPVMKARYPQLIFIGEAYNPNEYRNYIYNGKFDYLYDKVGLYDAVKRLTRNEWHASTWDINAVWNHHTQGIEKHMLRFLENHDEERIASEQFAGNPWYAVPGMIVSATLATGPLMVYFGQEVGEPAADSEGFSGRDGRTTIFDYWGVPEFQKWVNGHAYDGGLLSQQQQQLRSFYDKLVNAVRSNTALREGQFYDLMMANERQYGFNNKLYAYLRYTTAERVLIVLNFNRHEQPFTVVLPHDLLQSLNISGHTLFTDILNGNQYVSEDIAGGLHVQLPATGGLMLSF